LGYIYKCFVEYIRKECDSPFKDLLVDNIPVHISTGRYALTVYNRFSGMWNFLDSVKYTGT